MMKQVRELASNIKQSDLYERAGQNKVAIVLLSADDKF